MFPAEPRRATSRLDAGPPSVLFERTLPDVAEDMPPELGGKLDRVGMSGVECLLRSTVDGEIHRIPARVDAFVSLDDEGAKGIHMSRLFLTLHERLDNEEFSLALLQKVLQTFVSSHHLISENAAIAVQYEHFQRQASLLSDKSGWRSYPVRVESVLAGGVYKTRLDLRVVYSSTCPCSAALSRQLLKEHFLAHFGNHNWVSVAHVSGWLATEEAMIAAPHSQRSHGEISVLLNDGIQELPIADLIGRIEGALQTAVQAAVKRADEQDFARLCGTNLMFCEDAARRMKAALDDVPYISDYRAEARHLESLHPHDAVAVVCKGVPGGYTP